MSGRTLLFFIALFSLSVPADAGFNVMMMKQRPCVGTPWGTIKHGQTVTAYSSAAPAGTCASVAETRVCRNGVLSGSFSIASCSEGCALPWGGYLAHGQSVTAYQLASVPCEMACSDAQETRSCSAGALSGSFVNNACSVGACAGVGGGGCHSCHAGGTRAENAPANGAHPLTFKAPMPEPAGVRWLRSLNRR